MMAAASGYVAVLVLALYVSSPAVKQLYHHPRPVGLQRDPAVLDQPDIAAHPSGNDA